MSAPIPAALQERYDAIWRAGRIALSTQRIAEDPLPVEGGLRWGISAVLRPPAWSDALVRCAADVAARTGAHGVAYGPDNLHLTVQQLEPHRVAVAADDAALVRMAAALRDFTMHRAPPRITLRGLTASAGGVLVQGWPNGDLQAWRVELHRTLNAHGVPVSGPEASIDALRTTAHGTLSLHGGAVDRADDLIVYVETRRDTFFQTIDCDALWLVGYVRTATAVRLIEYGRFPFGVTAAPTR